MQALHFATKHGLEVTELMEVVKSTQRLNVECFPLLTDSMDLPHFSITQLLDQS